MDWKRWHEDYDRPGSRLARRLLAVQEQLRTALDERPPGPIRVVSLCAGQGRDLLGVLPAHPRRPDVSALLVELDPDNSAAAAASAARAGLDRVEVVTGDAAMTDHYLRMAPADLVLACGLFGNMTDGQIERTVDACRSLCATGGTVVWTRHRDAPDRVPLICDWFETRGFERRSLTDPAEGFAVGTHRYAGQPHPLVPGRRMFAFDLDRS